MQIGLVPQSNEYPENYSGAFFLALTLKNYKVSFETTISIEINYTYEGRRRRNLQRLKKKKKILIAFVN